MPTHCNKTAISVVGFVAALVHLGLYSTANADGFTLVLTTVTSDARDSETDEPVYFAVHDLETSDVSQKGDKNPRTKKLIKRVERNLDHHGDDREAGARETYRLKFSFRAEDIRGVEIGMTSGEDAWHLVGFEYYVEQDGEQSLTKQIPVGRWLSASETDKRAKIAAEQFYFFRVPPPIFRKKS